MHGTHTHSMGWIVSLLCYYKADLGITLHTKDYTPLNKDTKQVFGKIFNLLFMKIRTLNF